MLFSTLLYFLRLYIILYRRSIGRDSDSESNEDLPVLSGLAARRGIVDEPSPPPVLAVQTAEVRE